MSTSSQRQPLPAVLSPGLRRLLGVVLVLFGLLAINSLYLVTVTIAEALSGRTIQNFFYLLSFLAHLGLGLILLVPALVFGALHLRRARTGRTVTRCGRAWALREHHRPVRIRHPAHPLRLLRGQRPAGAHLVLLGPCADAPGRRLAVRPAQAGRPAPALAPRCALGPPRPWPSPRCPWPGTWAAARRTHPGTRLWSGPHPNPRGRADRGRAPDARRGVRRVSRRHRQQHERSMHRMSSFNNPAYRFSIEDTRGP